MVLRRWQRDLQAFADRVLPWPVTSRQCAADDDDPRSTFAIAVLERTTAAKRHPHHTEVVGCDRLEVDERVALGFGCRLAFDRERPVHADGSPQGPQRDGGGGLDARQAPEATQQLVDVGALLFGFRVLRLGGPGVHRENVLGVIPERDGLERSEAADQEPRADQQHEGEPDLARDEARPQAAAAGDPLAGRAQQGFPGRATTCGHDGSECGQDTSEQGGHDRDSKERQAHADVAQSRHVLRRQRDQQRNARDRDEPAEASTDDGNCEALDGQLACEPGGACAESHPHGKLGRPCVRRQDLQRRHVRTRHEQDERHRSEQREQHRASGTEHCVREGRQDGRDARRLVLVPVVGRRDRLHVATRLLQRDLGSEPAEPAHPPHAGLLRELAHARDDGRPELRSGRVREALGHHADDSERLVVEHDRTSHDARVRGEPSAPETMTEDDDSRRPPPVVLGQEVAAESRRHSEDAEEVRGHQTSGDVDRLALARQDPPLIRAREAREVLEHRAVRAPVPERRIGHLDEGLPTLAIALPDEHQPVRPCIRQRPQYDGVRHAEDGRRRANADGQRQDGDRRRRPAASADGAESGEGRSPFNRVSPRAAVSPRTFSGQPPRSTSSSARSRSPRSRPCAFASFGGDLTSP